MGKATESDERGEGAPDGEIGGMGVDEFLSHSTKGGGGSFLSGAWKEDGEITLWLHRGHRLHAVWFHNWYRVIEAKNRDGETERKVVSVRWNCRDHHPEQKNGDKLLRKAYFRDDTGAREHAPVLCPFCKFEDWLAVEVTAGRIGFVEPIFRLSPDEKHPEDKAVTLHAGGIVGFFNEKNMTSDEKRALKDAKISLKDAWKDKTLVRCNYLFVVVNDKAPDDGPLKFFAAEALGDKLKSAIRKEMGRDRKHPEKGNPIVRPYPFKIEYDDRASFSDKYDVAVLEEEPTDEIAAEIDGEKLDLSQELEPGNCAQLLNDFETHALVDAPWKEFFEEAEKAGLMQVSDTRRKRSGSRGGASASDEGEPERPAATKAEPSKPPAAEPAKPAKPEAYRCDSCNGLLHAATNVVCKHCGAVYDEKGDLIALACLADGCAGKVSLAGEALEVACMTCKVPHRRSTKTIDEGTEDEFELTVVEKVAPPAADPAPAKRARRSKAAAKEG